MTGKEIALSLELQPRATPDFPDALVALGLLCRDGDGSTVRHANTPDSNAFLDRASPGSIDGGSRHR